MKSPNDIAEAVAAIGRIEAVPTLLQALCDITGMRLAMVAHIRDAVWTVCAVEDGLGLGMNPGSALALKTNLALHLQAPRAPIVVEEARSDSRYRQPDNPGLYRVESYISVPIFLSSGSYFGTLCALDPEPKSLGQPFILATFNRFAALLAAQLSRQLKTEGEQIALLDERAAGELREQFIAILGHDLRNPLHAVFASSDLLARKLADPTLSAIAARIKTSAVRMSSLIDDVLDFARGRLGGGIAVEPTELENVNIGLTTVIQELLDAQPGVEIISNIAVNHPVRCDLGRLQQVASNLLANAITHGVPNSGIAITAVADESDLVLDVWNGGEPIPEHSLPRVFEPFWRHSVSASRQGLGLGLHICAQIVRAHAGSISVTSSREHGTRFTVRLPLAAPPHQDITGGAGHPAAQPQSNGNARHLVSNPERATASSAAL